MSWLIAVLVSTGVFRLGVGASSEGSEGFLVFRARRLRMEFEA